MEAENMQQIPIWLQAIDILKWPVAIFVVVAAFYRPILLLLSKSQSVVIKVPGGGEISIAGQEVEVLIEDMFSEVDFLIKDITDKERYVLKHVFNDDRPRVDSVFPNFQRDTEDHKALGSLRARNLIRPREGGRWWRDKHIQLTPFGRLVLRIRKPYLLP